MSWLRVFSLIAGLVLLLHPSVAPVVSAATIEIEIRDSEFRPAVLRVGANDRVTWRNLGPSVHHVVAANGAFDSGPLAVGQRFSFTFRGQTDSIQYACGGHGNQAGHQMQGTLLFTGPGERPGDPAEPPPPR